MLLSIQIKIFCTQKSVSPKPVDRWRKRDVKSNQINQQKHTPSKVRTKTGVAIYQNRTTNNTAKPMSFVHKKMSIQPAKKRGKKEKEKKNNQLKALKNTNYISMCSICENRSKSKFFAHKKLLLSNQRK